MLAPITVHRREREYKGAARPTGIFLLVFGAGVQDKERVRTRKSKAIFFERIKS